MIEISSEEVIAQVELVTESGPTIELEVSANAEPAVEVGVETETVEVLVVTEPSSPSNSTPPSAAPTYVHTQSTPAATWTIPNFPGARAIILAVYDDAGRVGYADVYTTDANTSVVFPSPRTGRVDFIRG